VLILLLFGRTRFTNYQYRTHDICVTIGYDESIAPNSEEIFAKQ